MEFWFGVGVEEPCGRAGATDGLAQTIPYLSMDAHQQNSGPESELQNPAVGPGLLVADRPQR